MLPSRRLQVGLAVACVVPSLSGIVVESRQWHGQQIQCIHGGAWATRPKACGTLDYEYERVFTGTVLSVTEISDTERRLEIKPKEIFLGDSKDNVTAIVNQACLTPNNPEIKAGDKWLFYLRTDKSFADGKPTARNGQLEIPFDGPSKPLRQAREDVTQLRRLARMTDSGILSGNLLSFVIGNERVILNHKIIATRQLNGAQYATVADKDGNFKFDPLPAGTYEVTADTAEGLWAGKSHKLDVHSGECTLTQFRLQTDGIISGHLGSPENKPFPIHPSVQIVSLDDERYDSARVDTNGNFEARGVEPGRYVVGIGIKPGTGYFSDVPTPVYYPGVPTKEQATIIQLGRSEKRTNVNFELPAEDVVKFMKQPPIPPKDVLNINVGQPVNH